MKRTKEQNKEAFEANSIFTIYSEFIRKNKVGVGDSVDKQLILNRFVITNKTTRRVEVCGVTASGINSYRKIENQDFPSFVNKYFEQTSLTLNYVLFERVTDNNLFYIRVNDFDSFDWFIGFKNKHSKVVKVSDLDSPTKKEKEKDFQNIIK